MVFLKDGIALTSCGMVGRAESLASLEHVQ